MAHRPLFIAPAFDQLAEQQMGTIAECRLIRTSPNLKRALCGLKCRRRITGCLRNLSKQQLRISAVHALLCLPKIGHACVSFGLSSCQVTPVKGNLPAAPMDCGKPTRCSGF